MVHLDVIDSIETLLASGAYHEKGAVYTTLMDAKAEIERLRAAAGGEQGGEGERMADLNDALDDGQR